MHQFPLQRPVTVECKCCHCDAEFVFVSHSDHVICRSCVRHQGDTVAKLRQRDADHVGLWKSTIALAAEEAAEREQTLVDRAGSLEEQLAQRRVELDDLRETVKRGFDAAPLPAVEKWLQDQEVSTAYDARDSAYRSRDHAYRVLWSIDHQHHAQDDDEQRCRCGVLLAKCGVAKLVEPVVGNLIKWEDTQIDRLRRGLECGLPREHPEWQRQPARPRRRYRAS